MNKAIDSKTLAMENIRQRKTRSTYMILLVALFSVIVYMGSIFSFSLKKGLESLSDRLGADVIVVPAGYKAEIESVLLKGEPSTFYLPEDTLEKLKEFDGIEKMSPQIYVATLSASCCSYPVQIMGIDIDTDFLIYPWISHSFDKELKDGEAIVGNHVVGEKGETIHFFNQELKIVGRLNQTGIGFDATVFVNRNTAKEIAKASERITANRVAEENVISSVMIKAKPGVDSVKLASNISRSLGKDGIFAMFSKKFVNSISANLQVLSTSIMILVIVIWILSIIILSVSFSAIFNERKKEMAVLRVLGASKKMLREIIMKEAIILSFIGAGIGGFIGMILSIIQLPIIASKFGMPFLSPSFLEYILIFILSFVLGLLIGPLSTIKIVKKLTDKDSYLSLREEI
ncbi:ABC transporter permease [Fusobacterium massiliense]|jgi:ABC transporter, permease protein|uniref:ABC transporter permease n=1 Tax=Fusobacterium massiliense TaxID=1852365 RepID=UPI0028D7FCD0|nr:ABC transporter permease [Fusobacterium massiliense]